MIRFRVFPFPVPCDSFSGLRLIGFGCLDVSFTDFWSMTLFRALCGSFSSFLKAYFQACGAVWLVVGYQA